MSPLPLIANPTAGGGRCGERLEAAVADLSARGVAVEVMRTEGPGHATALATRAVEDGAHTVLVAGGDGTTYEVLQGLMPWDRPGRPTLGALPLGTGNSFLRDLGITTPEQALDAIVRGHRTPVDVVRATHTHGVLHYLNLLSVGFTSDVGDLTNRRFKALGEAGYAVATVIEVLRLSHRVWPIRLDDGPTDARPAVFLSFSNSRCTGGEMQMAPDADVADGRLDVIRVGPMSRLALLSTFPRIYQGEHLAHPLVEAATAATVDLDLHTPEPVMIDGEVLSLQLQRLTVLPGAIEVFG